MGGAEAGAGQDLRQMRAVSHRLALPDVGVFELRAVQELVAVERGAAGGGEGGGNYDHGGAGFAHHRQHRGEFGGEVAAQGGVQLLEQKSPGSGEAAGEAGGFGGSGVSVAASRVGVHSNRVGFERVVAIAEYHEGAQPGGSAGDTAIGGAGEVVGDDHDAGVCVGHAAPSTTTRRRFWRRRMPPAVRGGLSRCSEFRWVAQMGQTPLAHCRWARSTASRSAPAMAATISVKRAGETSSSGRYS